MAHYVFVASAGAYNLSPIEPMHVEGDPRKSSAGHVAVEKYLEEQASPLASLQPGACAAGRLRHGGCSACAEEGL